MQESLFISQNSMKRVLFLFLDGVGLGSDDPTMNPLVAAHYPTFDTLFDGAPLTASTGRLSTPHAELAPIDALLGVPGRPQSATGQAAIVTGLNAPQLVGEHFGPRPDDRVRAVLDRGTIFSQVRDAGKNTYFVNGYPNGYFRAIESGKRRLSAIPYAVTQAGQTLPRQEDVAAGRALSAEFTGAGWHNELGLVDAPIYTPMEAGRKIWELAQPYDLLFFEHWLTDVLGHEQAMERAVANFQVIDGVLGGLLEVADLKETLIVIAADHGNIEDLSHRNHTMNPALGILIGAEAATFAPRLHSLTDIAPIVIEFLTS